MRITRLPCKDPRTVSRDIPGISDILFPQLIPAIVSHLNRGKQSFIHCTAITYSQMQETTLSPAMLFEISNARAEQILKGRELDWNQCIAKALVRQKRFFDAEPPKNYSSSDIDVAEQTANNLALSLRALSRKKKGGEITISPAIIGFKWIANSSGDFSIGNVLIETKCSNKNFSSADYRQLLMYWLLSYAASIEGKEEEWKSGILLNPRLNSYVEIDFQELVCLTSGGRSKVELLELFSSLISEKINYS
ncbi:hypothetical protein [Vibrio parahaemolyticus]|uniref:hypothetical protein n=1 Tax=Vibrio parahaemolyticus TaxID=670 RepID=UPI00111F6705|nr:hypothetical protein [Vibrio parahaemolyticus]TNZ95749.1 hypothetical protein CGK38_03270 [Vibrio parahaemolyticus]